MGNNPADNGAGFRQPAPGRTITKVTYHNVTNVLYPALNNNANRISSLIQNIGANAVHYEYSPIDVANPGLFVQAQGGYVDNNRWEDFDKVTLPVYLKGVAGGSIVRIEETYSLDPL